MNGGAPSLQRSGRHVSCLSLKTEPEEEHRLNQTGQDRVCRVNVVNWADWASLGFITGPVHPEFCVVHEDKLTR